MGIFSKTTKAAATAPALDEAKVRDRLAAAMARVAALDQDISELSAVRARQPESGDAFDEARAVLEGRWAAPDREAQIARRTTLQAERDRLAQELRVLETALARFEIDNLNARLSDLRAEYRAALEPVFDAIVAMWTQVETLRPLAAEIDQLAGRVLLRATQDPGFPNPVVSPEERALFVQFARAISAMPGRPPAWRLPQP